jgi:hypothetical protein
VEVGAAQLCGGWCDFGHGLELHVTVLELLCIILLEQDGADQADDRRRVRKVPTTSARRLTGLDRRSSGLVLCSLAPPAGALGRP